MLFLLKKHSFSVSPTLIFLVLTFDKVKNKCISDFLNFYVLPQNKWSFCLLFFNKTTSLTHEEIRKITFVHYLLQYFIMFYECVYILLYLHHLFLKFCHIYMISPVCVLMRVIRYSLSEKVFSQWLHWYGFLPVWDLW